jgi:hypothetical protein
MNKHSVSRIAAAAALTAGFAIAATVPAQASGGGGVENRGSCSGSTNWKVKAKHDDGRIEAEAEIDSNVVGQTWKWRLTDNGDVVAKGTSTTHAPSGSFEVRRLIADQAGSDRIGIKATNPATGETCKGFVTL